MLDSQLEAMTYKNKLATHCKSKARGEDIELGSSNVFADLGFQDAEDRLLKAKLAAKIAQIIEKKAWTRAQSAERTALAHTVDWMEKVSDEQYCAALQK